MLKKYSVRLACAVLCWALLISPCVYIAQKSFAPLGTGVSIDSFAGHTPSVNVSGSEPVKDVVFEGPSSTLPSLNEEDVFSPSDKVLSSMLPIYSGGSPVQAPAKPSEIVVQKPVSTPNTDTSGNTNKNDKIEKPVSDGTAQLFDTYALLPQPDGTGFVYYEQTWPVYTNYPYGYNTVGGYGCGPTSMAMVITNLTGVKVSPTYMADWSYKNGYYFRGRGTAYGLFPAASAAYGLTCSTISRYDKNAIVSALKEGNLLLTVVGAGDFTRGRHFLLIRGITDDGKLLLADSGKYENCLTEWDYNTVMKQVANSYFWVFE